MFCRDQTPEASRGCGPKQSGQQDQVREQRIGDADQEQPAQARETRVVREGQAAEARHGGESAEEDGLRGARLEQLALRRTGGASRLDRDAVAFLATNDFVTGATLVVDGGEQLLGAGHH